MKALPVFISLCSLLSLSALPLSADQAPLSKDLNIVHTPLTQVVVAAPPRNDLRVSAWVDQPDNTYRIGEQVQLFVRSNRDAYITVLNVGTSGKVHQLFPNRYQPQNFVKAGTNLSIPASTMPYQLQVSGPTGEELIKVIASTSPSPIIAQHYLNKQAIFPPVQQAVPQLAKDLAITLNHTEHRAKAALYNKIIYIR